MSYRCAYCGEKGGVLTDIKHLPDCDRDPDDIKIEEPRATRFPSVAHEPVERRTKITWCVGGKEVLHDRGDGTYEVARWPHASIEDLERLFYVIGELLTITQPQTQSKGQ